MSHKKKKHIYIIGIGGKGLNSIAEFCLQKNYQISGSDIRQSDETRALKESGAAIYFKQDGSYIGMDIDCVVYSSIISETHPERIKAKEMNIPQMERPQFLAQITQDFERISVAGSHGKSTTSALTAIALKEVHGSVNAITGAYIKEFQSYQSAGDTQECVLEACEYAESFLHIPGSYTLITALEKSHMEYFKNEEAMNLAFRKFIDNHEQNATLIINGDNTVLKDMCNNSCKEVVTCGFGTSNQYVIKDVQLSTNFSQFSIYKNGAILQKKIKIKIPGLYNILNVALVFALLDQKNLTTIEFKKKLLTFTGVGRRFEITRHQKAIFVDDFAHHPTQVKNLLTSIKQFFPNKKICAVFEPRQYHLIKTFLKEYGKSFLGADQVYVTDVVEALGDREEDMQALSTKDVLHTIQRHSKPNKIQYMSSYAEIVENLRVQDLSQMVIATIGAGHIFRVRDLLSNRVQ